MIMGLRPAALLVALGSASSQQEGGFSCVVLGRLGGVIGGDTTSFLLAQRPLSPSSELIGLDAGSLVPGLAAFLGSQQPGSVRARQNILGAAQEGGGGALYDRALALLRQRVGGFVVTHAHLDHTAGLALVSPELVGSPKLLTGTNSTLCSLLRHLFNNELWPNLAAEPRGGGVGELLPPHLAPFVYNRLPA